MMNEIQKDHYDVLIASPGLTFPYNYLKCLTETLWELNKLNISFKWLNGNSSQNHIARNLALIEDNTIDLSVNAPLNGTVTYNKIIWIDSDMVWTTEDFLKLYNSEHEIITGVYINKNSNNHLKTNLYDENFNVIVPMEAEVFPVFAASFGFIAIKSGIFEIIERPWFRVLNVVTNDFNQSMDEDLGWCIRMNQLLEIPIMVDPTVQVGHIQPMIINPSYGV